MQDAKLRRRRLTHCELLFLLERSQGHRTIKEGPLGRCLKRGWCEQVEQGADVSAAAGNYPVYAITRTGLDAIALAQSGEIRVLKG
jgi:hypothetical protein